MMEVEKTITLTGSRINTSSGSKDIKSKDVEDDDDDDDDEHEDDVAVLPGFRFHPTDEELVGFYLRRKVEKRGIMITSIELLIKQIDIYKYDPWDLPKGSNVGDKEWYFFCKRGRKYRNSIRPNRVTGSGFWKATGIDRPIYSARGHCIGLKKSLVYYRGSAGKGTKTDWMMHEFRLPLDNNNNTNANAQEAEVWTLCRIFKRSVSYRKCIPNWREMCAANNNKPNPIFQDATTSKTCSNSSTMEYSADHNPDKGYNICFRNPGLIIRQIDDHQQKMIKPTAAVINHHHQHHVNYNYEEEANQLQLVGQLSSQQAPSTTAASSHSAGFSSPDLNDILKYGDWNDLRSVVEFVVDHHDDIPSFPS